VTEAAAIGGVTRSNLSMMETGRRAPNPERLVAYTRKLGVPSEDWLPAYLQEERRCVRLVRMGGALYEAGSLTAARRALSHAYFISRRDRDGRYNAEIYGLLGKVAYGQNRFRAALRWFRLVERAVSHGPDARRQAVASFNIGMCLDKIGRDVEALERFEAAILEFRRLRLRSESGKVLLAQANLLLRRRAYRDARTAYRRASHLLRGHRLYGDAVLGVAITEGAVVGAGASLHLFESVMGHPDVSSLVRAKAQANRATALRQLGRFEEARSEIAAVLAEPGTLPSDLEGELLTEQTICCLALGDVASARASIRAYKAAEGDKDSQDVAAMRLLARAVGIEPPADRAPRRIVDDREMHFKAALELFERHRARGQA